MKTFILSILLGMTLVFGTPLKAHAASCSIRQVEHGNDSGVAIRATIKSGTEVKVLGTGGSPACTLARDETVYIIQENLYYPLSSTSTRYITLLANDQRIMHVNGEEFTLTELIPQMGEREKAALKFAGLKNLEEVVQGDYTVFPSFDLCQDKPGIVLRYRPTSNPSYMYPARCMVIDSGVWYGEAPK
jgi:hypothetical protein